MRQSDTTFFCCSLRMLRMLVNVPRAMANKKTGTELGINKSLIMNTSLLLAVWLMLSILICCESTQLIAKKKSTFEWEDTGQFSECSVTCGTGQEMTSVVCREARTGSRVREVNCYKLNPTKPARKVRECRLPSCRPVWIVDGDWSQCSATCADDSSGVSTRIVYCVEELLDGSTQRTLDRLCNPDEKPVTERSCSSELQCPKWIAGPWSPCSATCGTGRQERVVLCQTTGIDGCKIDSRPPTQTVCHRRTCDTDADSGHIFGRNIEERRNEQRSNDGRSRDFAKLSIGADVNEINDYDVIDERGTETSEYRGHGGHGGFGHVTLHRRRPMGGDKITPPVAKVKPTLFGSEKLAAKYAVGDRAVNRYRSSVQVFGLNRDEQDEFIPVATRTTTSGPRQRVSFYPTLESHRRNDFLYGTSTRFGVGVFIQNHRKDNDIDDDDDGGGGSGEVEMPTRTTATSADIIVTSERRISSTTPTAMMTSSMTTLLAKKQTDERDQEKRVASLSSSELKKLNDTAPQMFPRYRWRVSGDFTPCSLSCGGSGQSVRFRRVECVARHVTGYDGFAHAETDVPIDYDAIMPEYCCRGLVKPIWIAPCHVTPCRTAHWITTEWSQCSTSCGVVGVRRRKAQCAWQPLTHGGTVTPVDDLHCSQLERPLTEKKCMLPPCANYGCRDYSHYCSIVPQMSLCHLTQYRQRCCYSCQSSRQSRHVRRLIRF